jgi:hypothetical protein
LLIAFAVGLLFKPRMYWLCGTADSFFPQARSAVCVRVGGVVVARRQVPNTGRHGRCYSFIHPFRHPQVWRARLDKINGLRASTKLRQVRYVAAVTG